MPNIRTVQPNDPAHLKEMFALLGLSEIAGPKHEPKVIALYRDAGHPEVHDDETAWCAAAVGATLHRAGEPNTGSLMARSYEKYGHAWDRRKPIPRGAIAIWPRGAPPSGHVNEVLGEIVKSGVVYVVCIGGNQGNGRGGGVTIVEYPKDGAVCYRIPPGMWAALNAVPVPVPKPKPQPVDDEPDEIEAQPAEPPQSGGLFGHLKRRWLEWSGGATATGGVGLLATLSDPWAWAKFLAMAMASLLLSILILLVVALMLFGREPVKRFIRRMLPKRAS